MFITHSDISSKLPVGYDVDTVTDLLSEIETDLKVLGLTFAAPVAATLTLEAEERGGNAIFSYWFLKSVTSLKIKQRGSDSEEVLTLGEDYLLRELDHPDCSGIYYQIELISNRGSRRIAEPCYLELVGTTGFLVSVPSRIQSAIVKYIKARLVLDASPTASTQGQIKRSTTDDTTVEFFEGTAEDVPDSIIDFTDFTSVINQYLP